MRFQNPHVESDAVSQPTLCVSLWVAYLQVPEEPWELGRAETPPLFLWMRNLNFRDGDSSKWWGILAPLWMWGCGDKAGLCGMSDPVQTQVETHSGILPWSPLASWHWF